MADLRYTLPLAELAHSPDSAARAGEKAARVGRAMADGFAVPDGFVVTTGAFRAFVGGALAASIEAILRSPGARDPARIADTARAIGALVASTPLPEAVAGEVRAAYGALGEGAAVAVRSSAIGEDGRARSLAGHFDSFLDIRGEAAVLDAVRRCFASAWSERVLAARLPAIPEEAPIDQRMVRGGRGGVLFTEDPVGGSRCGRMIAEFHDEGAERVAGGDVEPKRLSIDRESGALDGASAGGLGEELLRLGRRAEALFAGPQDLEWAEGGDGRVYLLQARPVTGAAGAGAGGGDIWTAANAQEAIEDPVTPLTYTFMEPTIERGRRKVFAILGVADPPGGYMRLFFGRIYFNVNYFRQFLESVAGIPPDIFDLLLFGESGDVTFPRPPLRLATVRVAALVARTWSGAIRRMDRFVAHLSARFRALGAAALRDLPDQGLLAHLGRVSDLFERALNLHVLGSAMAGGQYLLLKKFLALTDVAHDENAADQLLAGAPGIETARSNAAIFDLARVAAALPAVRGALLEGEPEAALGRLRAGEVEDGARFVAALDVFLDRFGHRAEKEAELMRPRWRERPGFIIRAVRKFLELGAAAAAPDDLEHDRRRRGRALARRIDRELKARGALKGWQRAAFRLLLRWAEQSAPYRENLRFHALRALEKVRETFLEVGRRLVERRILAAADDVFFLEAGEALGAVRGGDGAGLGARATERKSSYEAWLREPTPPKFLRADGTEALAPARRAAPAPAVEPAAGGRRYLEGVPVSSGIVTGRVRLVERLEDGWTLKPDEILLARAATPSWTPLFFFARGVILDIGGMLSHCAVIAREYGIPCVVGLKTATTTLSTGDVVTVDAFKGRVYWDSPERPKTPPPGLPQ